MTEETFNPFSTLIARYVEHCKACLSERTDHSVDIRNFHSDTSSVVSALLGRQCALAIKFAESPEIWDAHIGPLIMRAMIDCNITLRWILLDPDTRAKEFIQYGLGLAKLSVSFFEEALAADPENEPVKQMMEAKKAWIGSQVLMPFVEVNLGSWHGSSVRKMCADIDDLSFYRYSYFPFSSCAHNTWDHISIYNAKRCKNPLHKFHYVGEYVEFQPLPDMMYNSAKYYSMSLSAFDEYYDHTSKLDSPLSVFVDGWGEMEGDADAGDAEAKA